MFSLLSETNFTLDLTSANALNLDQSNNLSFGKGKMHLKEMTTWVSLRRLRKLLWVDRLCYYWLIFLMLKAKYPKHEGFFFFYPC